MAMSPIAVALLLLALVQKKSSPAAEPLSRLPQRSLPVSARYAAEPYDVVLDNMGPCFCPQEPAPLTATPVMTDAIHEPTRVLPSPAIPAPRVVSQRCFCVKTIMRPQVFRRVILVPHLLRFIKKSYRPVMEKVSYRARPMKAKPRRKVSPCYSEGLTSLNEPSAFKAINTLAF